MGAKPLASFEWSSMTQAHKSERKTKRAALLFRLYDVIHTSLQCYYSVFLRNCRRTLMKTVYSAADDTAFLAFESVNI